MGRLICFVLCLLIAFPALAGRAVVSRGTFEELPSKNAMMECVLGRTPGCSAIFKFGHNVAVGTTEEDVWDFGGDYAGYPDTPQSIVCSSTDVDDDGDPADTGALTGIVFGNGPGFVLQSAFFTFDGQTEVAITGTWLRIWRVQVLSAGSTQTNEGTVFCEEVGADNAVSADDYAQIGVGNGSTLMALFTVPAGKTGVFVNATFSVHRGDDAIFRIYGYSQSAPAWRLSAEGSAFQGTWTLGDSTMGAVPEKTDLRFTAQAGTGTIDVDATFMIYLFDN